MKFFSRSKSLWADFIPRIPKKSFLENIQGQDHPNRVLTFYLKDDINRAKILLTTMSEKTPKLALKSLLDGDFKDIDQLDIKNESGDKVFWICTLFELARVSFEKNEFQKSTKILTQCLDLIVEVYNQNLENQTYKDWMASVLIYLGRSHYFDEKFEESMSFYNQAVKFKQSIGQENDALYCYSLLFIAESDLMKGNVATVLECIPQVQKALKVMEKTEVSLAIYYNLVSLECRCIILQTFMILSQGDANSQIDLVGLEKGCEVCNKAIDIALENGSIQSLLEFYLFRAHMETYLQQYDQALATLEKSLQYLKRLDDMTANIFRFKAFEIKLLIFVATNDSKTLITVLQEYVTFIVKTRVNTQNLNGIKGMLIETVRQSTQDDKDQIEILDNLTKFFATLELSALEVYKLKIDFYMKEKRHEEAVTTIEELIQEVTKEKEEIGEMYEDLMKDLENLKMGCEVMLGRLEAPKRVKEGGSSCTIL